MRMMRMEPRQNTVQFTIALFLLDVIIFLYYYYSLFWMRQMVLYYDVRGVLYGTQGLLLDP